MLLLRQSYARSPYFFFRSISFHKTAPSAEGLDLRCDGWDNHITAISNHRHHHLESSHYIFRICSIYLTLYFLHISPIFPSIPHNSGSSPVAALHGRALRGPVKPSTATAAALCGTSPGSCAGTRGTMRCSDCGPARGRKRELRQGTEAVGKGI